MDIKNEILVRVYVVLVVIVLIAIAIFAKAVQINVMEGEYWRSKGDSLYLKYVPVEAERGNVMAEDGSLLATSLPFFEIRFDPNSSAMDEDDFEQNLDSLAFCLATYVDNTYTIGGYHEYLKEQKARGARNMLIKRKATFSQMQMIKRFPLFRKGQYRGGLIVRRLSERKRPFGILAHRTIGYVREGAKPVGLEGKYNDILAGKEGKQLMYRAGSAWIPVNDLTEIEPVIGDDIRTTIDINMQDIAEQALIRGLQYHQAQNGTAVIMEVKTGAIKAIANVDKQEDGGYWESFNHAVGSGWEPGSTFKLPAIMALLEDGLVNLDDSVDIQKGKMQFYEEEMLDASRESFETDTTTIRRAFEISSNVGIASLVEKHYGDKRKADKFIEKLKEMGLHVPTGIEIQGEAAPYIKEAYNDDDDWSGTTLPWMSIGYELTITPLQLLSFYNAVANDGVMMKPYLVSHIDQYGDVIEEIKPTVVKRKIASRKTIREVKELLEGVVEGGTAHKLATNKYRFAGKTGTAQINYRKFDRRESLKHRASFVGYFPAENPVYSCMVVITDPTQNGIYGGDVAGPVFREIADKCFATRTELYQPLNQKAQPQWASKRLPDLNVGEIEDFKYLLNDLNLPYQQLTDEPWAVIRAESDTLKVYYRYMNEDKVPNVVSMGLRDALYVLENKGLHVVVSGVGKVARQSILPGTKIQGQTIRLTLN